MSFQQKVYKLVKQIITNDIIHLNNHFQTFRAYTVSTSELQCMKVAAIEEIDLELRWESANCEKEKLFAVCVLKNCE